MAHRSLLRIAIALVIGAHGKAIATADEGLSLADCLELALRQNPMMTVARQRQAAADARVDQAKSIPQLSLDYDSDMQDSVLDVSRPGETYLGVSTTVELPGRRALRIDIANHETAETSAQLDSERLELALDVKRAFFELLLAQRKLELARQNLDLANQFVDLATFRFETGDVARVEVLRAEVERAGANDELRSAENETELASSQLAFLVGKPPTEPLVVKGQHSRLTNPGDVETLTRVAMTARPEIRELQSALEREVLTEKLARRNRLPDLDVGVARHWIDGEGSFWDVTASVELPLFQQQYRGEIAEAAANRKALQHELDYLTSRVALEVGAAHGRAVTARERIDLFDEKLLREAREVYDMYLFSYREGALGGIELIDARHTLLDTNTAYAEAVFDHAIAVAELARAVGRSSEGAR